METNYHLPQISGDISGKYNFWYTPYFLGVAAALDDSDVSEIDLMKAAQIGWTYFLIGYIFKRISEAATGRQLPIMMLFAKEKDGKSFHDEKLIEAGLANSCLNEHVDFSISRKSGNRWDFKKFTNGFLKLVGSNSPGNVKSTSSVGVGVIEEPDDTSDDVKGQGDSISNLEERLKRYQNSKLIVGGTPAVKGLSKTEYRVEKTSDARVLPIACHECGEKHVLDFDHVDWDGKDESNIEVNKDTGEILAFKHEIYGYSKPESARYVCPNCNAEWDDYQRHKNIRETVFSAIQSGDENCGWVATKGFNGKAGFKELGEVYACIPGTTLADVVREYLEAEHLASIGDESKRIKFENQKRGRAYEYKSDAPDVSELRERCEDYKELIAPRGAYRLTAGVDLQLSGRIAIKIKGWGVSEESWVIYAGEIYGALNDKKDPIWQELDKILFTPLEHEQGFKLRIESISLDTSDGQTSDAAYHYVRTRQRSGVTLMAVKGSSNDYGAKEIFSRPRSIDTKGRRNTKAARYGLHVYTVGTEKAKDLIDSRMKLTGDGPGRMHWYEGIRDDYFTQMTGEVKAPNRGGRKSWQQKAGVAVEFWDCEVYALHAARAVKIHIMTDAQWAALENKLLQTDLFETQKHDENNEKNGLKALENKPIPRKKGGFVSNWRK